MSAYQLYSVDSIGERWSHGATADLDEAKRAAIRRAASGRYAYVKEFGAGTVFYIDWVAAMKADRYRYDSEPCSPQEIADAIASPRGQSLITPKSGCAESTEAAEGHPG